MERRRTIIGDETIDMNNKAFELLAEINVSDYAEANSNSDDEEDENNG